MSFAKEELEYRYKHERMLAEFPEIIHELRQRNAAVDRCIEMYLSGQILTKEECLYQMIKLLETDWNKMREHAMEQYMHLTNLEPIVVKKQK